MDRPRRAWDLDTREYGTDPTSVWYVCYRRLDLVEFFSSPSPWSLVSLTLGDRLSVSSGPKSYSLRPRKVSSLWDWDGGRGGSRPDRRPKRWRPVSGWAMCHGYRGDGGVWGGVWTRTGTPDSVWRRVHSEVRLGGPGLRAPQEFTDDSPVPTTVGVPRKGVPGLGSQKLWNHRGRSGVTLRVQREREDLRRVPRGREGR